MHLIAADLQHKDELSTMHWSFKYIDLLPHRNQFVSYLYMTRYKTRSPMPCTPDYDKPDVERLT